MTQEHEAHTIDAAIFANNGMNKPASMKDVARAAGVSVSTVSRVLNAKERAIPISERTRHKVLKTVEQLDYKPNFAAQRLRSAVPHHSIGLYIPWSWNLSGLPVFIPSLVEAVGKYLSDHSHTLSLVYYEPGDIHAHYSLIHEVRTHPIQGMIITGAAPADIEFLSSAAGNTHPHFVVVHRLVPDGNYVSADNRQGAVMAVKHLVNHGHSRIGLLTKPPDQPERPDFIYEERFRGYCDALRAGGLEVDSDLICTVPETNTNALQQCVLDLLQGPNAPTAMLCTRTDLAAYLLRVARRAGIRVPEDLAVVAFSEHTLVGQYFDPTLTTIGIPAEEMGHRAAEHLVERLRDSRTTRIREELDCTLTIRESCGCRNTGA